MVVHRNINVKKFIYFSDVELDVEFGHGMVRRARLMSKMLFYTLLLVKVYDYVELEIKMI